MILMPDLLSKRHIRTLSNRCKPINILYIYISWEETYTYSGRFSQKNRMICTPPFNTGPGQQFRGHVLFDKNGHLSVRDVYETAKLRILLKTAAKDGGFFTFTPILLR